MSRLSVFSIQPISPARWVVSGVVLIVVLIALFPWARQGIEVATAVVARAQRVDTLNHMRQVHLAASKMAEDGLEAKNPNLGWPGDLANSEEPVLTLTAYLKRLKEYGYLREADLMALSSEPGIPANIGEGEFTGRNVGFKIYRVRGADVDDVTFAATKNFTFGKGLDPRAKPYGRHGCCIVRKGGDAVSYPSDPVVYGNRVGLMPGSTDRENPGQERADSILAM